MDEEGFVAPELRSAFVTKHYEIVANSCMILWELRWKYIQLSLFGICAFYVAIFSRTFNIYSSDIIYFLVFFPPIIALFGLLHAIALRVGIRRRNEILANIEREYRLFGWAQKYEDLDNKKQVPFLGVLTYCYWGCILVGTGYLAVAVNTGMIAP